MLCTLCLVEIEEGSETVTIDERIRHKACSDKLEEMVIELDEIYQETKPEDI